MLSWVKKKRKKIQLLYLLFQRRLYLCWYFFQLWCRKRTGFALHPVEKLCQCGLLSLCWFHLWDGCGQAEDALTASLRMWLTPEGALSPNIGHFSLGFLKIRSCWVLWWILHGYVSLLLIFSIIYASSWAGDCAWESQETLHFNYLKHFN